ncbi:MAG TPA: hypothetical protein VNO83_09380 [Pseudonocardia sp.]|nr:hypothetical protein [Pseudonocardia sp.]
MTPRTRRRIAATVLPGLLAGLLLGCAAPEPAADTGPAPMPAPVAGADAAAGPTDTAGRAAAGGGMCADHDNTVSTVRGVADALASGPVLPAGVALFLTTPRARATVPGVADPALIAAGAELVAAIDDLDAQAVALLPPGGNMVRDPVQLDPTRIRAAAAELERLCAAG